jgi:hypothetical protein
MVLYLFVLESENDRCKVKCGMDIINRECDLCVVNFVVLSFLLRMAEIYVL